ncbi:hypothetical protein [Bacillus sp. AFS017336]|uniref:hypothetical protein n=1 Tax=Bacillus sp. AFS017336 TaxID=2033489 RepID=UPI000BF2005F|nr:hypothetical protein [Bacillus sp. AFS017336]PEL14459.1 hypothetical protein CN601_00110 [Bacillus sp. AFS017336]
MKNLLTVILTVLIILPLSSNAMAAVMDGKHNKKEHTASEYSNYKFKNPDAEAKAASDCFFYKVSWKMQDIFRRFDSGELNENEVAKLISSEISPLIPNKEYEIALELSEQKARTGR